jgi:hypothetical protein
MARSTTDEAAVAVRRHLITSPGQCREESRGGTDHEVGGVWGGSPGPEKRHSPDRATVRCRVHEPATPSPPQRGGRRGNDSPCMCMHMSTRRPPPARQTNASLRRRHPHGTLCRVRVRTYNELAKEKTSFTNEVTSLMRRQSMLVHAPTAPIHSDAACSRWNRSGRAATRGY